MRPQRLRARECLHISQKDLSRPNAETTHVLELARGLAQCGWNLRVVAPGVGRSGADLPFPIDYLPAVHSPRPARLLTYEAALLLYLCLRPGVWRRRVAFYVRKGTFLFAPLLLGRMLGLPVVLEVNGLDSEIELHTRLPAAFVRLLAAMSGVSFRLAGRIVVPVQTLADALVSRGVRDSKVRVVPNGVNEAMFSPLAKAAACKVAGLDENHTYICYCGHFGTWQGLHTLVEAAATAGGQARLLFVGEGPLKAPLEAQARRLGIEDRVLFRGPVALAEVPVYLSASDICVVPATVSTHSPVKLFEYLACERPVIGSDVPGVREVIAEHRCGWLAAAGSVEDWAAKIRAAISAGPAVRREMGRRGREAVLRHYTWRAAAEQVEPLLSGTG